MNILVLNASPKGKNSTTLHTALYLAALHPEHMLYVFFKDALKNIRARRRVEYPSPSSI